MQYTFQSTNHRTTEEQVSLILGALEYPLMKFAFLFITVEVGISVTEP